MPSNNKFDDTLAELKSLIHDIGDTVLGGLEENIHKNIHMSIAESDADGVWCSHGSHRYALFGKPEDRYFTILYPAYIVLPIASNLTEETIDEMLTGYDEQELIEETTLARELDIDKIPDEVFGEEGPPEDLENMIEEGELPEELKEMLFSGREIAAAQKWLDTIDDELIREIKFHLKERLSVPDVGYRIVPEESNVIYGIHITRKIFPYEDEFCIRELNHSVQAVVSVGANGNNFLAETFDFSEELSTPSLPG